MGFVNMTMQVPHGRVVVLAPHELGVPVGVFDAPSYRGFLGASPSKYLVEICGDGQVASQSPQKPGCFEALTRKFFILEPEHLDEEIGPVCLKGFLSGLSCFQDFGLL